MKFLGYCLIAFVLILICSSYESEEWISLLDKDLSQWENYLSYRHKIGYNGSLPKDENGVAIEPIGYNKNENKVFSVIEEKGQPILRISGEIYGCVYTKKEFENYHLKLQVKWAKKNLIHEWISLKIQGYYITQ